MQVEHFLEASARRTPGKVALVCGDRRLTYADIDRDANRLAHGLRRLGVSRGERVAIWADNSVEAVVSVWAILKAGGVFLLINPTVKADKLTYILNNCRAAALIADRRKRPAFTGVADQLPHLRAVVLTGRGEAGDTIDGRPVLWYDDPGPGDEPPGSACIDIDLAALVYTSGSTGQPKGVMLTHLNMVSAATSITTYLEMAPSDIVLNVLPLSFDYGLYQMLMTFKVGGTLVLERSFTYPHAVLELIPKERVTGLPLVPTMAAIVLQLDLSQYDLSSVRYISNTGAALATTHIGELRRLLPHVTIFSMYGLTECKRVSYLPPDQIDIRPTSVGRGMPNEEVYIVNDAGERIEVGTGELVIRGSNVMKGYWEKPEETDRVLRPGALPGERVLYSGDLFRRDQEGYLYFIGRKDDIIKSRGEKVSPREVENVLYALPGVADAAVVGVPDPILGQSIKAVLTLKTGIRLDEKDVLRHCSQRLEDFMVPKLVEFRDEMPKTSSGKIDKKNLHLPLTSPAATAATS